MTLIAPNGVTKIAGANVYAAKLATVHQLPSLSSLASLNISYLLQQSLYVSSRSHMTHGKLDLLVTIPAHQIGFRKYAKSSAISSISALVLPLERCVDVQAFLGEF